MDMAGYCGYCGEEVALNTTDTESTALIDEAVLQDREPVLLISHELSQT